MDNSHDDLIYRNGLLDRKNAGGTIRCGGLAERDVHQGDDLIHRHDSVIVAITNTRIQGTRDAIHTSAVEATDIEGAHAA